MSSSKGNEEDDAPMKELIKLYSVKLQTGYITDAEIEQYEELIQLYMVGMKRRLQGANNDNR